MASRWTLTLTDDDSQVLLEGTEVTIVNGGVLCLQRWSTDGAHLLEESYIAPHAWAEVHRGLA